jgi:hypothetical protein
LPEAIVKSSSRRSQRRSEDGCRRENAFEVWRGVDAEQNVPLIHRLGVPIHTRFSACHATLEKKDSSKFVTANDEEGLSALNGKKWLVKANGGGVENYSFDKSEIVMKTATKRQTVLWSVLALTGVLAVSLGVTLAQAQPPETKAPQKKLTGAELYAINCNRCHPERYPTEFTASQWKTIMLEMRVRANLPAKQANEILKYLQEDAGGN